MMKKQFYIRTALLLLAAVCMAGAYIWIAKTNDPDWISRYCYEINEQLKAESFCTAEITAGSISLFDENSNLTAVLPFNAYDTSIRIESIYKRDNRIYFVSARGMDEEYGYMFVNDGSDGVMKVVKTAGGYYYSTRK